MLVENFIGDIKMHEYGVRPKKCMMCDVYQSESDLVDASAIGWVCKDRERCKRWRIQLIEEEVTKPGFAGKKKSK